MTHDTHLSVKVKLGQLKMSFSEIDILHNIAEMLFLNINKNMNEYIT